MSCQILAGNNNLIVAVTGVLSLKSSELKSPNQPIDSTTSHYRYPTKLSLPENPTNPSETPALADDSYEHDSTSTDPGPPERASTPPSDPANPRSRKGIGGPATHKPGCKCRPCAARRRQEEAIALGTGSATLAQIPKTIDDPNALVDSAPTSPSKTRANVATWLKAKIADPGNVTIKDIAEQLGISPRTLHNQIYKGRKEGWLRFDDPIDEVRYGMVPKVVENLNLFLDTRDKQVTLEMAKATVLRQYQAEEGIADVPNTIFALKIELPENFDKAGAAAKIKGVIVGKPIGFVDAEIVDVGPTETE